MRTALTLTWALVVLTLAGCASPPEKEIGQAQGAIDAARAAGADIYAVTELQAAVTALDRANQAVTGRDYRLALNDALDSREHAQAAAREAAEGRARARGAAERAMAEAVTRLGAARERLSAAEAARAPARVRRPVATTLASIDAAVQEARAAMDAGDYARVQRVLTGLPERISDAVAALETAEGAQQRRRAR